jgi:hypothetical protein
MLLHMLRHYSPLLCASVSVQQPCQQVVQRREGTASCGHDWRIPTQFGTAALIAEGRAAAKEPPHKI